MDNQPGLRSAAGGTPGARRDTPIPGRAVPGNPASGSRTPGGGQFIVALSKTSRVKDQGVGGRASPPPGPRRVRLTARHGPLRWPLAALPVRAGPPAMAGRGPHHASGLSNAADGGLHIACDGVDRGLDLTPELIHG